MNARIVIVALVAAVIGGVVGVLGYTWVVGGNGEASAPIAAPTLDVNAVPTLSSTQAFAAATQVAELSTQVAVLQSEIDLLNAPQQADPVVEATEAVVAEEATEEAIAAESSTGERNLYRINPESSEVTFFLQEDLRGVRTDVVGTTSEVAGDIILDFSNPAGSQVGTIRINARTLATNNDFRNRALRAEILQSANDEYEFIEFVPTGLNGVPASITVGDTYTVEIVGDLTMVGRTNPVTFTTDVTVTADDQISGTATASVQYADWGIVIPSVPSVANVTEDVTLTINFVADQVAQ